MTHTPTPWDIDALGYLRGPNSENILEEKDNAAFVVKAVNCHEELLQALKDCLLVLESHRHETGPYKENPIYVLGTNEAILSSKKAIAKAEEIS